MEEQIEIKVCPQLLFVSVLHLDVVYNFSSI